MSAQPKVAERLFRCPECRFTAAARASFPLERDRRHGADIRRCPDCDTKVTL